MSEDISSSIKMPLSGWSGYIEEPSEIQLINKESIQKLIIQIHIQSHTIILKK